MSIPKPLVQINQLFILVTVLSGLLITPYILLLPLAVGIFTLITKNNPIILFSKHFLQKAPKEYPQEDKQQQIFNQWIATVCIGLSVIFFSLEITIPAYAFSVMVIIASGLALLGFCIGCTIRYRYMMWRYKRAHASK
ncbi:protein of unknown function [Gracilibacillus ureilyticus]|uniref:DUF4395 domain-containing protein n=1 Tax=Gracilibacillus ureilyticus TaxID=531814 RepID=A0A1H9MSC2_9BACI|nr:DUF4395 domain-containing protein [Gracilibacillus ureilyticus]SER26620.1 protein of unknown function [Gracilibacillus ureilyticus]